MPYCSPKRNRRGSSFRFHQTPSNLAFIPILSPAPTKSFQTKWKGKLNSYSQHLSQLRCSSENSHRRSQCISYFTAYSATPPLSKRSTRTTGFQKEVKPSESWYDIGTWFYIIWILDFFPSGFVKVQKCICSATNLLKQYLLTSPTWPSYHEPTAWTPLSSDGSGVEITR